MSKENRILLKALEIEDVNLLLDWENDQSLWHISETYEPFSSYKMEMYIRQTLSMDVFGARQVRLMIHQELDHILKITEPIGTIEVFEFDPFHKHAGIGIMLHKDFQGQGIGKKALDLFLKYLSDRLQLRSVYANVSETNVNSLKFFENYGFRKVGEYKDFLCEGRQFVSQITYQYLFPQTNL